MRRWRQERSAAISARGSRRRDTTSSFIARGANLAALRQNGLTVDSVLGDLQLKPVNATDDPARVGPVDIVLFAVKLWDTEAAAEQARPLVGPATRVITLQNGID